MSDYNRWSQNQFTIGLKGDLNNASNAASKAREDASKAKQQAEAANQRASSASLDAHNLSSQVVDLECTIIDKDLEISKLNQKLEETEAQLQQKFNLLKDYVLSHTAWKAVAQKIASENGIDQTNLQEQVDKVAIDHANQNPNHGFETTTTFINSKERIKKKKPSP